MENNTHGMRAVKRIIIYSLIGLLVFQMTYISAPLFSVYASEDNMAADIQEEARGDNFLKDSVFKGNETAYLAAELGVGLLAPGPGGEVRAGVKIADEIISHGDEIVDAGKALVKNSDEIADAAKTAGKNTNPFKGAVDDDVIIVDPAGNAIPIRKGEQIQGSPDGKMLQVKDQNGNPTGDRYDGLGHPKQSSDPAAQLSHGHRVDSSGNPIVSEGGNPHLPVHPPNW